MRLPRARYRLGRWTGSVRSAQTLDGGARQVIGVVTHNWRDRGLFAGWFLGNLFADKFR